VYIDHGAWHALGDKAGLLPAGIVDVEGSFAQQEAVRLVVVKRLPPNNDIQAPPPAPVVPHTHTVAPIPNRNSLYEKATQSPSSSQILSHPPYELHNPAPFEIGRAVVNYSVGEIRRIKGLHSTQIHEVLGYADSEYVALRENIALVDVERSRPTTPAFGRAVSEYGDA
jgi:glutamate 5-kinase